MFIGAAAEAAHKGFSILQAAPAVVKGIAGLAIAGVTGGLVGAPLGLLDRLEHVVHENFVMTPGHGTVYSTYPLQEGFFGGYDTNVQDAKADMSVSADLGIGSLTIIDMNSTYNGSISTRVGIKGDQAANLETVYHGKKRHVTVHVKPDQFETLVTPTDPTDPKNYSWGGNFVAQGATAVTDLLKGIPVAGPHIRGMDGIHSSLAGYAFIAASETAVEGCGSVAWKPLKPQFDEQLKEQIVSYANALDHTDPAISVVDVDVDSPEASDIHFDNPFKAQLAALQKASTDSHMNVSVPDPKKISCKASSTLHMAGSKAAAPTQSGSN